MRIIRKENRISNSNTLLFSACVLIIISLILKLININIGMESGILIFSQLGVILDLFTIILIILNVLFIRKEGLKWEKMLIKWIKFL